MARTATRQAGAKPAGDKPERDKPTPREKPAPKDRPARDTRDDPAPNPDAGGNQPDTATRQDVEKLRRNLKR
ncbi:hypothetical protein SLT36_21075 [Aminobacter sp. BA135]|uniref:hypothetical protein n=1 Tax=Aminobacter sp. BA135 TaxID=537596 RepID=UPI003D792867